MYHDLRHMKNAFLEALRTDEEFCEDVWEALKEYAGKCHHLAAEMGRNPTLHGHLREHFVHHDHYGRTAGGKM